jgi:hypothetical protein
MATEDIEEKFIRETKILMGMSDIERKRYVNEVILGVAKALQEVVNEKAKIKKAQLAQKLGAEFEAKSAEITTAFLYAVKPEYLQTMLQLLKAISGTTEAIKGFE